MRIYSEVEKLKKVILHRPGKEIENLIPEYLSRLLFDDIPYLEVAKKEHDNFAKILVENGAEIFYIEDLLSDILKDTALKEIFIKEFLKESEVSSLDVRENLFDYLVSLKSEKTVEKIISGIRKDEIPIKEALALSELINKEYPFYIDPMPNLYFTRDIASIIGRGVSLNSMFSKTRKRETYLIDFIFKNNSSFSKFDYLYERKNKFSIEGGDILVLSSELIAIGCSQRTSPEAIELLAKNIFSSNESFNKILVFHIPNCRAFMHLDTVFTMIDYDKFTIHPEIEENVSLYEITRGSKNNINIFASLIPLNKTLEKSLKVDDVKIIKCGGGDRIIASREQWNDGSNTLALAPGVIITYERNYITNEILDKLGVKVIAIKGCELSRGRGGPRCMSMPIFRG